MKNVRQFLARAADYVDGKVLAGSVLLLSSVGAMAQETDPFEVAITTVTGKVQEYGTQLVALSAVGVVFWLAIRYVKRIPSAG